jgi:hypothetical protein
MDQGEDSGVRTDAESDREDDRSSESWVFRELAESKLQGLHDGSMDERLTEVEAGCTANAMELSDWATDARSTPHHRGHRVSQGKWEEFYLGATLRGTPCTISPL